VRLREERATERSVVLATKAAKKETIARAKAAKAAEATAARVACTAEKAQFAQKTQDAELRRRHVAESAKGH
jgi:hypothetical protein